MMKILIVLVLIFTLTFSQDDFISNRDFQQYDDSIENRRRPPQLRQEFEQNRDPNPFRNRQFSNGGQLSEISSQDGSISFRNPPDQTTQFSYESNRQDDSLASFDTERKENLDFITATFKNFDQSLSFQSTKDPFHENFGDVQNNELGNFGRPQGPSTFASPPIRHHPQVDEFGNPLVS